MTEILPPKRWQIVAAFAAIYIIWGSTYLGIAFAIESMPPFIMAGSRFVLAGIVLYAWARLSGVARPTAVNWRWALLLGALFFLVGNGAVAWVELRGMPSGLTALVVAMIAVWTALLEWFRPGGSRPSGVVVAGIALGFGGVAMLVLPGRSSGPVDPAGITLLLFSTFTWALGSVLSRDADLPASTPLASGIEMLAGGMWLFVASVFNGDWAHLDLAAVTAKSWISFAYLTLFGSLIAFTAFAWLLRITTPSKVATAGYVNPIVAVFLGWTLAGEKLSGRTLLASLVIVAAVVLIITGRELVESRARAALRDSAEPEGRSPAAGCGVAPATGVE
jgi:drug/metabolite transporter (DMT)-like permease